MIATVLTMFGQADDELNRHNEGVGVGLPLTKSFIELHGGSLEIHSELGQGTCLRLVFPASRLGEAASARTAAA